MNLWDALTAGAAAGDAKLHCWTGDAFETAKWADVTRDAERTTAGLRKAGVEPGARVATILTNTRDAVRGLLGAWLAGGTVASFPVPARGMAPDEYVEQISTLVDHLDPAVFMVDEFMLGLLPDDLRERANARSWESVADSGRIEAAPPDVDDVAFIQYSSGSTSMPKGCMLTPRAIYAQTQMIIEMIGGEPGRDVCATWLPLSHDMGLFGTMLTPWAHEVSLVLSPPERFTMTPRTWFQDVAHFGATYTAATNTALRVAARRQNGRLPKPLSLKTVILGAERIEWSSLKSSVDAFGADGLTMENLMPAYGMAEATLAVTHTPAQTAPRYVTVDAVALADGEVIELEEDHPSATRITSSGVRCPGVELPGLRGDRLEEIKVSSPSLAVGYYGDDQRTAERFSDGVFSTADIGFERDGFLFPVGRLDDLISIGGRKVYARELEAAVDALDGVRAGCSTVVERREGGDQRLTLLLELRDGEREFDGLARSAAEVAMRKAAVVLDDCLFLERGALPKTPSGKIQRYRCRSALDEGRFEPLAAVELAGA